MIVGVVIMENFKIRDVIWLIQMSYKDAYFHKLCTCKLVNSGVKVNHLQPKNVSKEATEHVNKMWYLALSFSEIVNMVLHK